MATKTKTTAVVSDNGKNRIAEHADPAGSGLDSVAVGKFEIVTFTVVGITPLLQNNPVNFIGKSSTDEGLATKKTYNDDEEARLRVYRDAGGNFCHPCEAFTKAMVRAATGKKIGKMAATSTLRGSVFVAERFVVLEGLDGKPFVADGDTPPYEIDRRSVVVGTARVLRCRPIWTAWQARVVLEVDTALVSVATVIGCLSLAGRTVGVGDNRPEVGGENGRFRVLAEAKRK